MNEIGAALRGAAARVWRRRALALGLTAGFTALLARPSAAQEVPASGEPEATAAEPDDVLEGATITLVVDGMTCPFCAVGLERQLEETAGVEETRIRLADGTVSIRVEAGEEVSDEALRRTVERAGFTLREIRRAE